MNKIKLNPSLFNKPQLIDHRDGVKVALKRLVKNKDVVVLSADLEESTRVLDFKKECPDRFFEVGVAEQNLASVSAGLAISGKISLMSSFGVFSPARNWEQIRISICYQNLPVIILGSHAGITVGEDGATHQALEDIAITRCLPNMRVIAPCDALELEKAIVSAVKLRAPVYIRFHRQKLPLITQKNSSFKIGRGEIFWEGCDVAVFACGSMVFEALLAARELEKEKISVKVINLHTIKPIDKDLIIKTAKTTRSIVTVEEHQIYGGMGSAIAEVLASNFPVPIEFIGVDDRFGESGNADELLEKYHLTAENIKEKIKKVLGRKALLSAKK